MKIQMLVFTTVMGIFFAIGCGAGKKSVVEVTPGPMPPDGSFDGVFQSSAWGRIEITLNGNNAFGLFESDTRHGQLQGTIDGNLFRFTWMGVNDKIGGKISRTTGKGYFRYVVEVDKLKKERNVHWLKGEWGYGEDNAGNVWEAVRLPRAKKRLENREEDRPSEAADDDIDESGGFGIVGGTKSGDSSGSNPSSESDSVGEKGQN